MTDEKKLNGLIEKSGLKKSFIARELSISRQALDNKLKNKSEFKASEIVKLQLMFGLNDKERSLIFFNEKVN